MHNSQSTALPYAHFLKHSPAICTFPRAQPRHVCPVVHSLAVHSFCHCPLCCAGNSSRQSSTRQPVQLPDVSSPQHSSSNACIVHGAAATTLSQEPGGSAAGGWLASHGTPSHGSTSSRANTHAAHSTAHTSNKDSSPTDNSSSHGNSGLVSAFAAAAAGEAGFPAFLHSSRNHLAWSTASSLSATRSKALDAAHRCAQHRAHKVQGHCKNVCVCACLHACMRLRACSVCVHV